MVDAVCEELSETNKIFKTLMHFPGSTFSDLWDKSVESNKFTYFLKKMEKDGLVEKQAGKYFLTLNGKAEAVTVSGETGKNPKRPFVALLLVARRNGKFVLYNRFKEPFYGVFGFPGAKVEFGESILGSAARELKEETGLSGNGKIIAVHNILIVNNNLVFAHMTQFVVLFDEPVGELIADNREGTYVWALKEEILSKKNLFPDVPVVLLDIESKEFSIKEIKLFQENEKFCGVESKKIFSYNL